MNVGDSERFFMFLTVFMIKFRSLRENESIIAPCAWTSEADGSECGVFFVVTKTQEGSDSDYSVAGIGYNRAYLIPSADFPE